MSKSLKERLKDCDEHDPRTIKMYEFISQLDFNEANDAFGFVSGGDGDNGEHLMYLMDCYYAALDDGSDGISRNDDELDE
jgi:hypothetical protein